MCAVSFPGALHDAQVQEQKGLDIVRRDWCPVSKDVGNFALTHILSGRPAEDVVEAIHAHLREVKIPACCSDSAAQLKAPSTASEHAVLTAHHFVLPFMFKQSV
jgi:DNA polymerase elongation subunit (family B)